MGASLLLQDLASQLELDSALGAAQGEGRAFYMSKSGAAGDSNGGRTWANPVASLSAALARAVVGDRIYMAPGLYNEAAVIPVAKSGIALIGVGPRGSVGFKPVAANATALTVKAPDTTILNVGAEGNGTGGGLLAQGDRFRAQACKFEGGAIAVRHADGASGESKAADGLYRDCEFAWADKGLRMEGGFHGGITQLRVEACRFHDVPDFAVGSDAAADHLGNSFIDSMFELNEDGSEPTAYVLLNGGSINSGIVARSIFPTAINGGKNLVDATVKWVSNYHSGGISTAQPS